jgi:hypothetical protein
MANQHFEDAYRRTSYCLEAPGEILKLRVGVKNQAFDLLLEHSQVEDWAFITAFNPGSIQLSEQENQERHEALADTLRHNGYKTIPCNGVDDDNEWPTERGYVILGIQREVAEQIAREFGQYAILAGQIDKAPELVMLVDEGAMTAEAAD